MACNKPHKQIASSGSIFVSLVILAFAFALQPAIDSRQRALIYVCAYIGMIGSPAYLMLGIWDLFRRDRRWRTVFAVLVSAVATVVSWRPLFRFIQNS